MKLEDVSILKKIVSLFCPFSELKTILRHIGVYFLVTWMLMLSTPYSVQISAREEEVR